MAQRVAMMIDIPQSDLNMEDPYQVYIYMMLVVRCDKCGAYLNIDPPFGEDESWDWYRVAANQARSAGWHVSPFEANGDHPMICLCPLCRK
jgi:hypothetical protein